MQTIIESPIGTLFADASARGLRILSFLDGYKHASLTDKLSTVPGDDAGAAQNILDRLTSQLDEYFSGKRRSFNLPLDLAGTPFQRRIWQAIAAIPFGETASYAEVAVSAGAPNAYRAAGTACGSNPVVVLVPCHRVVGTDRGLHGFGGGLDAKVWLLRHEGSLWSIRNAPVASARQPVLA